MPSNLLLECPFPSMFKCKITQAFDRYGHTVVNLLIFFQASIPDQKHTFPKERIPMNKAELIQTLCTTNGLSKVEVRRLLMSISQRLMDNI
jgi:hypothetical protein